MAVAVMRGAAPEECLTLALKTSAGGAAIAGILLVHQQPLPVPALATATSQACPTSASGRPVPFLPYQSLPRALPPSLSARPPADLGTPMAPELGLFLDECYFDAYNKQWGEQHPCLRQADFSAEVDAFKVGQLGWQDGADGADGAGVACVLGGGRALPRMGLGWWGGCLASNTC